MIPQRNISLISNMLMSAGGRWTSSNSREFKTKILSLLT